MYVSLKLTSFVYVVLIILNDLTSCVKGFFDVSFLRQAALAQNIGFIIAYFHRLCLLL